MWNFLTDDQLQSSGTSLPPFVTSGFVTTALYENQSSTNDSITSTSTEATEVPSAAISAPAAPSPTAPQTAPPPISTGEESEYIAIAIATAVTALTKSE